MKALALAAAVLIVATAAHAETARELRNACTGMSAKGNASMCFGKIAGLVNGLRDNPAYCIPKETTNRTVVPAVQKYLEDHPENTTITADDVVGKALAASYPCLAK